MTHPVFWHVAGPESTRKLAEWVDDEIETEQVRCPINDKGHRRGGKRLTDLSITLPRGTVQDIVWTWYSECLLQDHVLQLFRENKFTGFDVKPVKARFKSKSADVPPRLWELVVTGWAGMAPPESGIKLIKWCEGCAHAVYSGSNNPSAIIDESQWDGSDFFMVWPLPKFIFGTDRVAQVIRDNRLTGVVLKKPDDLDLSGTVGGGRLSYWMPEPRARKLGEAAGIAEI